ncbi:hypothetical protein OVN20_08865 [Microcella daejeonensis]|uniref:hypothetical protein n=1 Tax=Microcella daejeonensis TaxID=2994971 RepID=UPI0022703BE1|nr:hypothetical protein [Microcella daejeonensis]WAB83198.1 hypothetical protein OVN20_08865 [Microcella daejeonensis]
MPTIRARRALPPRSLVLSATAALLVALAGCSDTPAIPDADPTPTASPLFASEEEALEAAIAVWEEYNAVAYEVRQDEGRQPERLEPLLSAELYMDEVESIQEFVAAGTRTEGTSRSTGAKLQQFQSGPAGIAFVSFYACSINDEVVLLGEDGQPSETQPPVVEVTLEVIVESQESGDLFISKREFWAEGNQCDA